jgi:biopolymer transport protein TolR
MIGSGYDQFSGKGRKSRFQKMSEINVTPFVDVMLVLLIVFMVTAPLLTVGVPLDLPKTKAANIEGSDEPLIISINAEGQIYLEDIPVALEGLVPKLEAVTKAKKDQRIFIRGDQAIEYGRVLAVMGEIQTAGFKRLAMISGGENRDQSKDKKSEK